ncbi:MAG: sigma-70 family RNA polymerase sigma factor [Phycisphaerales bacterium]|nr:sigma-70 family RNA polymerase sigma factor [Phycisphaerales bacterium]
MQPSSEAVTQLVKSLAAGDPAAGSALFPLMYDELRALAGSFFRNQPADHTLQPTALVHEAFVKLVQHSTLESGDRAHFMALAARVMRQVLVDHARGRSREKRGGDQRRVSLDSVDLPADGREIDVLALEEAMSRLGQLSEQKARLVELRFFGGLTEDEAADVLQISRAAASRDWRFARAWLINELWPEAARDA